MIATLRKEYTYPAGTAVTIEEPQPGFFEIYFRNEWLGTVCKEDLKDLVILDKNATPLNPSNTQITITSVCDQIKEVLLEKNKRYGNAALNPEQIFSKLDSGSSILVRIDDKISRIKNSNSPRKNDVFDLIGYLTLYSVLQNWDFKDLID